MKWPVCSALLAGATRSAAFINRSDSTAKVGGACQASQLCAVAVEQQPAVTVKDRPLLRKFGQGINDRVVDSSEGHNRSGLAGHYTSEETIPCLGMQCGGSSSSADGADRVMNISSRKEIRKAYTADSEVGGMHGRSSGSGCSIIRLTGKDAKSVRGLVDFADDFFDGVDDDTCNVDINGVGVIRVANNVHAGFDANVNGDNKMQVLYTKMVHTTGQNENDSPYMLPCEVGDLVGTQSMNEAHDGMNTLLNIGSQITSAVLGSDVASTDKLLDDCTRGGRRGSESTLANSVSNSYQRLIRYLEPKQLDGAESGESEDNDPAFWAHVDSTFLTLIPMTAKPGLEVWCPSEDVLNENLAERGEWVRPIKPIDGAKSSTEKEHKEDDSVYVFALAGEFLQLLSDGNVPTCIHRVIPPPASPSSYGFSGKKEKYIPRVSAPLFVRPRRGEDATLDTQSDLNTCTNENNESKGLHFEEGLLEECDGMCIWEYMDCMSPNN